jgi:hypothetical protein
MKTAMYNLDFSQGGILFGFRPSPAAVITSTLFIAIIAVLILCSTENDNYLCLILSYSHWQMSDVMVIGFLAEWLLISCKY